jgi:hypothetical protein
MIPRLLMVAKGEPVRWTARLFCTVPHRIRHWCVRILTAGDTTRRMALARGNHPGWTKLDAAELASSSSGDRDSCTIVSVPGGLSSRRIRRTLHLRPRG